ncbi:MAG: hypothetical protein H6Q99_3064 [Proteobacteria bacterium]|nr:hypothetical protein [Pseudomonadota bacterium]
MSVKRLLAGIRLRDQQLVEVDAELASIDRVERVLGIDESADAAALLRLGHGVQRQRRLARRLRTVDLDDTPLRQAADAERNVETERAGRYRLDFHHLPLAEAHDGPLAESPLDLRQRGVERFGLVHRGSFHEAK